MMFPALVAAHPYVQSGRVRVLGVTTRERTALAPEIPTVREAGVPGYEVGAFIGLFAAKGTADAPLERIHDVVTRTLAMPEIREAMLKVGLDPIVASQANFKEMVRSETARWAKVIKEANIQTE